MTTATESAAHPPIATRDAWLAARKVLLEQEKALTRQYDAVSAQRRRLPMVKLEKQYTFDAPGGSRTLLDLFEGRRQLIVYHFMFDPEWEAGCSGCTGLVNALGDLSMLADRTTTYCLVSRAPLAKLETYKAKQGWRWPWYSSNRSDFNYDFHATLDENIRPPEYNYRDKAEMEARRGEPWLAKASSTASASSSASAMKSSTPTRPTLTAAPLPPAQPASPPYPAHQTLTGSGT